MLFNSLEFLIFLALFFIAWPWMKRTNNTRWGYLTVTSFFFYGWWDWRFLFLITGVGLINFFAGMAIDRLRRGRLFFLVLTIIANLLPLAIFKYLDFSINNLNAVLSFFNSSARVPLQHIILPVGISFYTFQAMSYSIGIYQNELKPTYNVLHFFAYLALFPQLVAGPIVRASHLLPQLTHVHTTTEQIRWDGFKLVIYGYFKKVVVADTIAPAVSAAFSAKMMPDSGGYWWTVMILFAYQIYCDFSGYSDIARGLGKWMGYDFPVNFDHPYISASFREFWTRWHISLSTWFRDYVYIPLGGSRHGKWAAHKNMWITMLLSGLWHGAAWPFIIWSALHAFYLSLERITKWPEKLLKIPFGRHLTVLAVFILTVIAWVFFRTGSLGGLSSSEQLSRAGAIIASMFSFHNLTNFAGGDIDNNAINVMLLMLVRQLTFHFGLTERRWLPNRAQGVLEPFYMAVLILMCVFMRGPADQFIYFQF
ncbi:MAG: MBOAT family protein [Sedimentisphaerales bacterium]|nr:MBOAT family protein [Sedimentisphaerales bacterium]